MASPAELQQMSTATNRVTTSRARHPELDAFLRSKGGRIIDFVRLLPGLGLPPAHLSSPRTSVIQGLNTASAKATETLIDSTATFSKCMNPSCPFDEERTVSLQSAGKRSELLKCRSCKMARYCSASCQKAHWKVHKPQCASWAQMPAARAPSETRMSVLQDVTAFSERATQLVQAAAWPLTALAAAWRQSSHLPPVLLVEIEPHASGARFAAPIPFSVTCWQMTLDDITGKPEQHGDTHGRGRPVHDWLVSEGWATLFAKVALDDGVLVPGLRPRTAHGDAIRSGEAMFCIVTTPQRESVYTKGMMLWHSYPMADVRSRLCVPDGFRMGATPASSLTAMEALASSVGLLVAPAVDADEAVMHTSGYTAKQLKASRTTQLCADLWLGGASSNAVGDDFLGRMDNMNSTKRRVWALLALKQGIE